MGIDINSASELAQIIDHTILKPEATEEQIKKICEEANLRWLIGDQYVLTLTLTQEDLLLSNAFNIYWILI